MAPVPAEPSSRPRDHNAPGARLRDHARITSHLATWPRGAGTRACRVPTHRDACRTCTKARPDESGRGRLRVRVPWRCEFILAWFLKPAATGIQEKFDR